LIPVAATEVDEQHLQPHSNFTQDRPMLSKKGLREAASSVAES